MNSNQLRIAVALPCRSLLGSTAFAEEGVSGGKILFGQVAALTGPAQDPGARYAPRNSRGLRRCQSLMAGFPGVDWS